jgi:hypothetical protein
VKPTDGLIRTKLFALDGDKILPSVSVPKEANANTIELHTPLPEELSDALTRAKTNSAKERGIVDCSN